MDDQKYNLPVAEMAMRYCSPLEGLHSMECQLLMDVRPRAAEHDAQGVGRPTCHLYTRTTVPALRSGYGAIQQGRPLPLSQEKLSYG